MQTKPKYKNRSWLREQYIQKGKTMDEIAEKADCSHGTVYRWMEKLNIKRRSRSPVDNIKNNDNQQQETLQGIRYVKKNMETNNKKLQEQTGLTKFLIRVTKEAKRNNYYKGAEYNNRGGNNTKFDKMTDKMENWLREKATDREDSWNDIKNQFNHKFGAAKIAPISENSANKWGKKLASEDS